MIIFFSYITVMLLTLLISNFKWLLEEFEKEKDTPDLDDMEQGRLGKLQDVEEEETNFR